MEVSKIMAAWLTILQVFLVTVIVIYCNQPASMDRTANFAKDMNLEGSAAQTVTPVDLGAKDNSSQPATKIPKLDKLLGGLLAVGFDERSCLSRYQSSLYRSIAPNTPSSYLLSRLRSYEDLHKRCGPGTQSYNESLKSLKKFGDRSGSTECKYVVWLFYSGLGNKILTVTSAFLYALLTNRILLVDRGTDMADLFCEPFPETSWLLPLDFPIIDQFNGFDKNSPHCYGHMLKNNVINASTESPPSYLYLHLAHDYGVHDKVFFCDQHQTLLGRVPWLIMKTNNYFVPSLFLTPCFEQELSKLFPEKDTIFHHLGRYLFHPSNQVWGLITRYYEAYLAQADERIGIQIRIFDAGPGPFKYVMDQILDCAFKEKLLPQVSKKESIITNQSRKQKTKVVLMTSLISGFFENLKNMYWEHPTATGEIIEFYQPSHEEVQQSGNKLHNNKALAEMYLLSLTDVLVTSARSTFGYVAQGLGGLKPWILYKPENRTTPNPPCRRAMSMEPCFHAPPFIDCKTKKLTDIGERVSHVRRCEDMSRGLKLVDIHDEL